MSDTNMPVGYPEEEMNVELRLDDGRTVMCGVVTIFEVGGADYVALAPRDQNLTDPERRKKYRGDVVKDHYGRQIPKHAHGTANLDGHTSSTKKIMCAASELFDRIVDKNLLVRRLNIVANHVLPEADAPKKNAGFEQLDLFTDYAAHEVKQAQEQAELEREKKMQQAMLTM